MEEKRYVKLKDLVDSTFTLKRVWGYDWQLWLPAENRMNRSDTYVEGHNKTWQIDTDKGKMDLSNYQFCNMLSKCFNTKTQIAEVEDRLFEVKSNGKSGMEIRYFINLARGTQKAAAPQKDVVLEDIPESNEVDLGSIPF